MTSVLNMGKDVLVNTTVEGGQFYCQITKLADGGWVIVWEGKDSTNNSWGVFSQRFDAAGRKVGGEVNVNTHRDGTQDGMNVAGLSGGGYVVTWISEGQDGASTGVFGQRYDAFGNAQGGEFQINTNWQSRQYGAEVTALNDGGFVVVWHSMNTTTNQYEIKSQRYRADGIAHGSETLISSASSQSAFGPSVEGLASGGYVVTWPSYEGAGAGWGLYYRIYSAYGTPGAIQRGDDLAGGQVMAPKVSQLSNGGFVICWQTSANKADIFDTILKVQTFDASGNRVGDVFTAATYPKSSEQYAEICGLSDGGFIMAWSRSDDDYLHHGTYFQRFDAMGNAVGPEILVNEGAHASVGVPDIIALDDGGFVFAFDGNDGDGSGIFYRKYQATETLSGTQYLWGTADADDLDGGSGNDRMYGGKGNDTYHVNSATDLVYEAANQGDDTVETTVSWTLGANVENLILEGSGAINGTGNASNNYIVGNSRNNLIDGGAGDDQIEAGGGNDSLTGGDGNDYIEGGSGNDTFDGGTNDDQLYGDGGNDWFYYSIGMDYIYGGSGVDSYDAGYATSGLNVNMSTGKVTGAMTSTRMESIEQVFGTQYDDTITGSSADNILDGRGGNDVLKGGDGDDIYYVESDSDIVIETAGQGYDVIYAAGSYTLAANAEELWVYVGHGSATGNTLDNRIYATGGNNLLNGMTGADTMEGGGGNDTYVVDNVGDMVIEYGVGAGTDYVQSSVSYGLGLYLEHLVLTGTANINGGGNTAGNSLTGNTGLNILTGGQGDDTYFVQNSGDVVVELAGEGDDVVVSSATFSLAGSQTENITLTGSEAINATGNELNNVIAGNTGNNVLTGGLGDDSYYVQNTGDKVVEASGQGNDVILSTVSFSLVGTFVETLGLGGTANIDATGNSSANTLIGNAGNNVIDGGNAADTMIGGAGNDTYYVQSTGDQVIENAGEGTDMIYSTVTYSLAGRVVESLVLTGTAHINATGNSNANSVTGNDGNNVINGMGGKDVLAGGAGADTFLFQAASGQDRITDFSAAENDLIHIKAYSGGVVNGGGVTISQSGADTVIDLGGGNSILVLNTSAADPNFLSHIVW